jgi:hypothetical protein
MGSMVLYRITPQSGIDHDLVSVVKILLKAQAEHRVFGMHFPFYYQLLNTFSKPKRGLQQKGFGEALK